MDADDIQVVILPGSVTSLCSRFVFGFDVDHDLLFLKLDGLLIFILFI